MKQLDLYLRIPAWSPPGENPYLAGDLNNWEPGLEKFRFKRRKDGFWHLRLRAPESFSFKITRGDWSKAEADVHGAPAADRLFRSTAGSGQHWLSVPNWTDGLDQSAGHTSSENVVLLHPGFYASPLGRRRRIWAYLPPDYHLSERRYPVIYMQDGQNLFDAYGSFSGEWAVDKALNRLFQSSLNPMTSCIVVGVENGGPERIDEYSPWPHPEYGGGRGDVYLEFLINTLKPYIDDALRTLPSRENTGIMGSSMGGLMALYAALDRPDIFGMAGVFSPSLWFSKQIFALAREKGPEPFSKILLMAGQRESPTMVKDLLDLYELLLESGRPRESLYYELHSDGEHSEWFWAREFEHAIRRLLGVDAPRDDHHVHGEDIHFEIRPGTGELVVLLEKQFTDPVLEIRDYCHGRLFRHPLVVGEENVISYREWEHCVYSVRILSGQDLVFSRRVPLEKMFKNRSAAVQSGNNEIL